MRKLISAVLCLSLVFSSLVFATNVVSASEDIVFDENNVVLNFGSLSDIHFDALEGMHDNKLAKAIKTFQSKAGGSDKLSALAISGDLTNQGTDVEHQRINKILNDNLNSSTRLVLAPGNHDVPFASGAFSSYNPLAKNYGDDIYQNPVESNTSEQILNGNYHTVINGFHFITVFSTDNDMSVSNSKWLDANLKIAQKDDPTKPIFVLAHVHPYQTCYGSNQVGEENQRWQDKIGVEVLKKYPQAISFTGHTHFPVTDDSSLWQEEFTSVNTGSMRYMSIEEGFVENGDSQEGIDGTTLVTTSQMVQVDKKGVVKITRYNLAPDGELTEQIKEPFIFNTLQKAGEGKYSKANRAKIPAPYFPENAKFNVSGNTIFNSANFKVNFQSALAPNDMVQHYEVEIKDKTTNETLSIIKSYTKFFFFSNPEKDMPKEEKTLFINTDNIKSNTSYELSVYAIDSFGNKSIPLTYNFKSDVFSDTPIFDYGYKPILNFDSWQKDKVLATESDYKISTVQADKFSAKNNALKIEATKASELQTYTIDVTKNNDDFKNDIKTPKFLTFMLDTSEFKTPVSTCNISFSDGNNTYKAEQSTTILQFFNDSRKTISVSDSEGNFPLVKKLNSRIVIPLSAFSSSSSDKTAIEGIKNIKSLTISTGKQNFSKSNVYIDNIGVLVEKKEANAISPPLLIGEVKPSVITPGDVDNSGSVTTLDVLFILKHIAKIQVLEGDQLIAANYDLNAFVNTLDALSILKALAGIE